MVTSRSYSDLVQFPTFLERYEYLRVNMQIGVETFGFERWLNQGFYRSREWKRVRQEVIARDRGCDLGLEGHEIHGNTIIVHHMRPINVSQLTHGDPEILDSEFLITTSLLTHNAIHYGDAKTLPQPLVQRRPGDTTLW